MSTTQPPVNPRLLTPEYRAAVRQIEAALGALLARNDERRAREAAAKAAQEANDDAAD